MKNLYRFIASVFILTFVFNLTAQQQNRFWYFGNNIGIDFGQGLNDPQPISGIGNFTDEGSGVISDNNGNFLLYTDGSQAINNQGVTITTDLTGNPSSTQSSIIVPAPGNCNEVYIFSVDFVDGNQGLSYNIVNTQDWSVSPSISLCDNCEEKVTVVPHSNGTDQWIMSVRPGSKRIPIYLLSESGVTLSNDSELGFIPENSGSRAFGSIRGSHDGSLLAIAYGDGRVDLLSFDNTNGNITNFLTSFSVTTAYGLEFSPNNEYLLVSGIGGGTSSTAPGTLRRYSTFSPYSLVDNITIDHNSAQYEAGALQLGPDGKIYMARDESNWLDVINSPDDPNDWGYQEQAIEFECTRCVDLGLPNLVGAPNECDPCDISNSLIPNPDFEDGSCDPTDIGTEGNLNSNALFCATSWEQATQATSDYFDLVTFPDRSQRPSSPNIGMFNPPPPNGSNHFIGGWRDPSPQADIRDPETNEPQEYIEYVGAELLSPIIAGSPFSMSLDLGAPASTLDQPNANNRLTPEVLYGDFIVLGIPDNAPAFPIPGTDCKEDNFEVIGRTPITIPAFTWRESVEVDILAQENYNRIMFGLSCETEFADEPSFYFLLDEILVVQGDLDCGNSCYAIASESPPCNAETDSESENTYTYDFTFTNNNEVSFDKLLLFDNDENFALDAGGTLIQLPSDLAPGQSVELSWGIDALRSLSEETTTYCFEIAPYNHDGPCCKAQHCIELDNCCEVLAPVKSLISSDTEEGCCYNFGYETCVGDYFMSAEIEILTEGLTLEVNDIGAEFNVEVISDAKLLFTAQDNEFLPIGDFSSALELCVGGMTSISPEEQEVSITWQALIGTITGTFAPELCPLACTPPEDDCAELIEPSLFCDDDGVYHYQFSIKNVNDRMLDASIAVLGPEGNTLPTDFSQATFPDFPDHTPNGDPFLVYNDATDLIDITLPNAVLGSNYEFIISLHDYRNINAEDGDYWCCYTPVEFTIDVTEACISGLLSEEPLLYSLYPNPAKDFFSVAFHRPLESEAELLMTDINGVVQHREDLEQGTSQYSIGVGEMQLGLYLVSVQDKAGHVHYERFFKN